MALLGFIASLFQSIAKKLCHSVTLLKKNVKFEWSEDCESAFKFLKEQLQSPELLSYPDFSRPFILQTDASDFALGYVLAQEEDEALLLPIRYGGRILPPSEIRYAPTEKELFAIFCAVKREEVYAKGHEFIVYSNHEPLTRLQTAKEIINKRHRWIEYLQELGTVVKYLPGKDNVVADFITHSLKRERKLDPHCIYHKVSYKTTRS